MKYEYIPYELKAIPNWVCWRAIPDANSHSGIRKVPINPLTGGQAMSNNAQTWSSFETSLKSGLRTKSWTSKFDVSRQFCPQSY